MNKLQKDMFFQLQNKHLFEQAQQSAYTYLDNLPQQRVFPDSAALEELCIFDEPLPKDLSSPEAILSMLATTGAKNTTAQNAGRYFGFVNGNSLPVTLATKWLTDVWDQNAALYVMSPIAAKLEAVCQSWLNQLLDLPSKTVAGFVSGTSVATLSGLVAARYRQLEKRDWDINKKGLYGAPKLRLILGQQTHGTVAKAISILGFGQQSIEWVECDKQGRMKIDKIPQLDNSCIIVLQAGNVNSGAFDDFAPICKMARAADAWVHIDGAFGLWARASSSFDAMTLGIEQAHSWSVDAHKTLNTPYDCGIVLCQDKEALTLALHQQGSYLEYSEHRDGLMFTPEMSKRARAIELWAALKYLGSQGVSMLVQQLHMNARTFAVLLEQNDFQILNKVVFNQVIVACETDELTQETLNNIQLSGVCWCGGSIWMGKQVIRISVCSWATTKDDITQSVSAFVDARELAKTHKLNGI